MNRTQQAVRPRFLHAIIEDDLVLAAQSDDSMVPSYAGQQLHDQPVRSLLAGIRINGIAPLMEFRNSRPPATLPQVEDLDQALAEIGRRATFTFGALLELPVLLAMYMK